MNIETRFNINQIVKPKFDRHGRAGLLLLEVKEIKSIVCSAGPQNFYKARLLVVKREYKKPFDEEGPFEWTVAHIDGEMGWKEYREDELIECTDEEIKIIIPNNPLPHGK